MRLLTGWKMVVVSLLLMLAFAMMGISIPHILQDVWVILTGYVIYRTALVLVRDSYYDGELDGLIRVVFISLLVYYVFGVMFNIGMFPFVMLVLWWIYKIIRIKVK